MEFKQFKEKMQDYAKEMFSGENNLFVVDVDKDELWNLYLDSFPAGTNDIFRERRFHDCSCCRHFIKSFGNVVCIKDNKIVSIWDFKTNDSTYQPVIKALSKFVKSKPVKDVFITKDKFFGTDFNHEQLEDGTVKTWHHFKINLPKQFVTVSNKSEASITGEYRDVKNVFQRSLEEITKDSIESVLDLISCNSLYKGEEWKDVLVKFLKIHNDYHKLKNNKDNFCWKKSIEVGAVIGKIKNHSIGVLLSNISSGMYLDEAVRKYEAIVAPTNYKRPKAIFTKKMIDDAQKTITDLGFLDSLQRRFATIDDITINNIIFANKDVRNRMIGNENIFDELKQESKVNPKSFDKLEEIKIDDFVKNILSRTTNIELYLENKHSGNLVSLIAPKIRDSKTMFKWNNNFSWAYNGNITDSMKERVKSAGGNVEGVLRFSLQWNESGENLNDFDAHCKEPNGNVIYFENKKNITTTGVLDVDIIHPHKDEVAVENITWSDINKMKEGVYRFRVHNYSHRGGTDGFRAEIEFDDQIYSYNYPKYVRYDEYIEIATVDFNRRDGFRIIQSLPNSFSSKNIWGLNTNEFHQVSMCMYSPNYWDEQSGIGNKHYFFILNNCKNENQVNGFFNEFLKEDLLKHKRVFEALGSKMKVDSSDVQLSGLGFSSTQRNSVVCKVEGHVKRVLKIIF